MDAGRAIFELLTTNTTVRHYCSTRVFPNVAAKELAMPHIVYTLLYNADSATKDGPSQLDMPVYQISIFTSDAPTGPNGEAPNDVAKLLREAVRYTLERVSGTIAGVHVQSASHIDQRDLFDEDAKAFHLSDDYQFRIIRSNLNVQGFSPYQYTTAARLAGATVDEKAIESVIHKLKQ